MQKTNSVLYIANNPALWALVFLAVFYFLVPAIASAHLDLTAPLVPCGTKANPKACEVCDLYKLAHNIIDLLLWGIATPLLIVALLAAGFYWLTSGGSEEKISKGRTILVSAVTGFIIAFGAWVIINTILSTLAFKNPFDGQAWDNTGFCSQSPIK